MSFTSVLIVFTRSHLSWTMRSYPFHCFQAIKLQLCTVDRLRLELKLSSSASFSTPLVFLLVTVAKEWFKLFQQPFLLNLATFIYFLLVVWERFGQGAAKLRPLSARLCDVCLCENEKRLGMITPSYLLEMDAERTCGCGLLNKVHRLQALI